MHQFICTFYVYCFIIFYIYTHIYTSVFEKDYIRLGNIDKLTIKKLFVQETQINK